MKKWFLFILFFVFTSFCFAQTVEGLVVIVLDGDTFIMQLSDSSRISVRLRGIDAPEAKQQYGRESKKFLQKLIEGKNAKLDVRYKDIYGRTVGYVWLNGENVNLLMIKEGLAWVYREFLDRPYVIEFYEAEKKAREQRKGLWKQKKPLPPWEWRRRNK